MYKWHPHRDDGVLCCSRRIMYLQGVNLKGDALIQAMGMLFMVSTFALALSL